MNRILSYPILLIVVAVAGCGKKDTNLKLNHYSELIKGDWVTNGLSKDPKFRNFMFSFQDSLCSYQTPYGKYTTYKIISDTLIIKERTSHRKYDTSGMKKNYLFKIIKVNSKHLHITPFSKSTTDFIVPNKGLGLDTLKLSILMKNNDVNIERIGFYSTMCYGSCPSMYLEIDSVGNILFSGGFHTKKQGMHSGRIPSSELNLIFQKINNIPLDNLKESYSADWTDDQKCGIKIKTKNGEINSNAYGIDEEPVELRLLFHKLMEVYKVSNLIPDSTINDEFVFQKFKSKVSPINPPPPPPTLIEK